MTIKVRLFGIEFDNCSMQEAIHLIEQAIKQKKPSLVVTPNAQHINIVKKDKEFKKICNEASLVFPDSVPLIWASRILGQPLKERVAGSDILPTFCKIVARKKYKIFLLGAEPGVAKKAAKILESKNPGLVISDTYSPPFGFERDERENLKIIKMINTCKPDVLFVGLGTPKQEKWSWNYKDKMSVPVIICVGATFDFIAQKSNRAPYWMQKSGLEWFHRLCQEPRRLWKRYLIGNIIFILYVIKEFIIIKFK